MDTWIPIEIRVIGESTDLTKTAWAHVQIHNEDQLTTLLCDRLGKSETEALRLLKACRRARVKA